MCTESGRGRCLFICSGTRPEGRRQSPKGHRRVFSPAQIQHREVNGVGIATLNRPKALNALNTNMVTLLLDLYRAWDASPSVNCIILKGTGGKVGIVGC